MADPFSAIVGVIGIGATAGVFVYHQLVSKKRFMRESAAFDDVRPLEEGWARLGMETTRATPAARIVSAGGGKNNPARWDCTSTVPPLALRTTLHIDREGTLGGLRENLGKTDVHTGDAAFDRAFCLRGSDDDIVRGVFQRAGVQAAVRALFEDKEVRYVKLDEAAVLYAYSARSSLNAARVRQKALALSALAQALIDAADAQPVAAATSPLRASGIGGGSGAPVGVPLGDRR